MDRRKVRINKYEKRRRAKTWFQKDGPNADQREKEREDHIAHQDRSGSRGHLHRVHPRVEQKPVHRLGHAGAVVQIHQQQHEVLVFEQPRKTSRRQTQRERPRRGGVSNTGESRRSDEDREQQTRVRSRQRGRREARLEGRQR